MAGADDVDKLIGGIYEAAVSPDRWSDQLKLISDEIGSAGAALFAADAKSLDLLFVHTVDMPAEASVEYDAHYLKIDPRVRYGLENPSLEFVFDSMHITDREINRNEYYDWMGGYGWRYYIAGQWQSGPSELAYISVQRTPRQGHVTADQVRLFEQLLPHVRRGVAISRRLEEMDRCQAAALDAVDRLPHGVVLLDDHGRVLTCNRAAEAIFVESDGLARSVDGIHSAYATDDRQLQRLIGGALKTNRGGTIPLLRPSGRKPFVLTVAPYASDDNLLAVVRPAAIVMLTDPETQPETPADVLRNLYGLTAREAELATLLATGTSLDAAADQLAMAKETARRHVKSLFKKTDTRRQAELVRLLVTLPPVEAASALKRKSKRQVSP